MDGEGRGPRALPYTARSFGSAESSPAAGVAKGVALDTCPRYPTRSVLVFRTGNYPVRNAVQ